MQRCGAVGGLKAPTIVHQSEDQVVCSQVVARNSKQKNSSARKIKFQWSGEELNRPLQVQTCKIIPLLWSLKVDWHHTLLITELEQPFLRVLRCGDNR